MLIDFFFSILHSKYHAVAVPFLDLKKINHSFQPELDTVIRQVVDSGWYILGNNVKEFEADYGRYCGAAHCIGVANGLDALRLILRGYIELGKLKEGDEVIVPANTYIASILAITDNKLVPVLAEPDPHTFNIDISRVRSLISSKTKAIMIVHLYGLVCWSEEIEGLAEEFGLIVIEDNAQASGAVIHGRESNGGIISRRTGGLGHAAGHSFYPGKNLGALGDGGAVTTSDDDLAHMVRCLSNYGSSQKYVNILPGVNSRLDELQAAVLKLKLSRLDEDNALRVSIAERYVSEMVNPKVRLPTLPQHLQVDAGKYFHDEASHVWHLFVTRTDDRDGFQQYLHSKEVFTIIHYPIPPHKQKAYSYMNEMAYPTTEAIHQQVLSLPISPVMSEEEISTVIEVVNAY